jgi:3-deoxy-D-manno-octulosonate 8-phosphate phosphatase (KDO 8-P phosphatase)
MHPGERNPAPDVLLRASRIRLLILDVDGVLTDGRLYRMSEGTEARAFHVRDGLGIRLGQRGGIEFAILSGRRSSVVDDRARELGITEVHQGADDKGAVFRQIADRRGLPLECVGFMGDDVVDVPAMRQAGLAVAPADAGPEALAAAHWTTRCQGGAGAVREVVDLLLRAQGSWERVAGRFLEP